jgi:hypothetical protein
VLADIERVLDGRLADMTFTDPPYNVDYGSSAKDTLRGKKRKILNDDLGAGFEVFLHDACADILAVTKGAVYVCMSSSELHTPQRAFTAAGGKWSTFVIWAKHTFTLGRADYQRQYEPILYGWRDGHDHYWCGARDQGDAGCWRWWLPSPAAARPRRPRPGLSRHSAAHRGGLAPRQQALLRSSGRRAGLGRSPPCTHDGPAG